MAKYNITVKANSDSHCNGTRFTKDIPFPSTVINGNMDDVANHIKKCSLNCLYSQSWYKHLLSTLANGYV